MVTLFHAVVFYYFKHDYKEHPCKHQKHLSTRQAFYTRFTE